CTHSIRAELLPNAMVGAGSSTGRIAAFGWLPLRSTHETSLQRAAKNRVPAGSSKLRVHAFFWVPFRRAQDRVFSVSAHDGPSAENSLPPGVLRSPRVL